MDRTQRLAWVWDEARRVLHGALERELDGLCSGDLQEVEGRLQQVLRVVGGALVGGLAQVRLAGLAGQPVRCPGCGAAMRYVAQRDRQLEGLVSPVRLHRPYYHCAGCGRGLAPLDEVWGLGAGGLTPALARVACRDGIEAAFGEGSDLLHDNLGVWLDEEQVPERLVLEMDGVLLHEVDAWREMKVGRVAPLGPALVVDRETGDAHLALGCSTYCVGREEAAAFWPRVMRELVRAGWGRGVRVVVLIADGADWIWQQARCQVRREGVVLVEILDFYHASEQLAAVAKTIFGAGSLRASDWLDRQCHALRHQGPTPVRRALAKLAPPTEAAAALVRKTCRYLRTHAARMNYPAFRARHFPIGSGAIESCAKNLIQTRQVQAGMRWTTWGAQCLASRRALHRSGRWETFWQSRPQQRVRCLHPRRPSSGISRQTLPTSTALTIPGAPPAGSVQASHAVEAAPPSAPPKAPPVASHTSIQTTGKPWAKGKDHWRRGLPRTA